MAQEFDDSFKELEQSVMEDMKRVYSEKTIDHFLNPRNLGEIPAPDGFGRVTGPCGDTMEICLKVRDGELRMLPSGQMAVALALPRAAWLPRWLSE